MTDDPPEDDLSVDSSTDLFRRVSPAHWKLVGNNFVLREGVFKNFPNPELKRMSVVLGDTLAALRRGPDSVLSPDQSDFGVIAISAEAVRLHEQTVHRTPRPEESAHGDVYGEKPAGRRKALLSLARWVVYPGVQLDGGVPGG